MNTESIDWKMTAFFVGGIYLCVPLFKAISLYRLCSKTRDRSLFFLLAPVFSLESLARARLVTREVVVSALVRGAIGTAVLVVAYTLYWYTVARMELPTILLGYLAVPILYFWAEAGSLGELLLLPTGRLPPNVNRVPIVAKSLSEFWGDRWNTWLNDLFFSHIVWPLRRHPSFGIVLAFAASGALHEILINLPLYCFTGRNLFGSQMLYFVIQSAGIFVDRKVLFRHSVLRLLLLWFVVLAPVPLLCNEALLRILHLWP